MNNLSFGIRTAKDFFNKLVTDYELFKKDRMDSGAAVNFAITAWHLYEWTRKESDEQTSETIDTKRKALQLEFQILRDIANGSKHMTLTYEPKTKDTDVHEGEFSDEHSDEFDISGLLVKMKDGQQFYFHSIADRAFNFWMTYYVI